MGTVISMEEVADEVRRRVRNARLANRLMMPMAFSSTGFIQATAHWAWAVACWDFYGIISATVAQEMMKPWPKKVEKPELRLVVG